MTRKDFELLAQVMREARPPKVSIDAVSLIHAAHQRGARAEWNETVEILSNHLKSTNPRFDIDRFVGACKA